MPLCKALWKLVVAAAAASTANPQSYRALPRLSRHGRRNQSSNTQQVCLEEGVGKEGAALQCRRGEKFQETNLQVTVQCRIRIMNTQAQCCACNPPKTRRATPSLPCAIPPKDALPVRRQFISCLSTEIFTGQIFPLLWLARAPQRCPRRRRRQVARLPPLPAHIPRSAQRRTGLQIAAFILVHERRRRKEGERGEAKASDNCRRQNRPCNGRTTTAPLERLAAVALTFCGTKQLPPPPPPPPHSLLPFPFRPSLRRPTFQLLVFSFS